MLSGTVITVDCEVHSEEDRLGLNEVPEGVPTDSEPDGDDNPWMNGPAGE